MGSTIARAVLEFSAFFIVLAAMAAGFVWADQRERALGISSRSSESLLIEAELHEQQENATIAEE